MADTQHYVFTDTGAFHYHNHWNLIDDHGYTKKRIEDAIDEGFKPCPSCYDIEFAKDSDGGDWRGR